MALGEINKKAAAQAIERFDRIGLNQMLAQYGGEASARWHICHRSGLYDQKVVLRAAHELQGLGPCLLEKAL